jgi:DNA-binding SARP family transcriptional activator
MLRLRMFGSPTLMSQGGSGPVVQRLRLALLVLLANAGDNGLSRDKLIGFLWAESQPDSARHKLEQALYMLRRQLGEDLFDGTDPLRLNTRFLTADVREFEQALDRGHFAEAVSLYIGPFLDGFYVNEAEEFERWVESERSRLAGRYRRALEELAKHSTEEGDHNRAVEWWRKLAAVDPLSSRATLGLMRALAAAGDRPAALRHGQIYEQLVREEVGSEPDPTVLAFMEELRAVPGPQTAIPKQVILQPPRETPAIEPTEAVRPVLAPSGHARRRSHVLIALIAVLGLGLILVLALRRATSAGLDDPIAHRRIVIVPFHVAGVDSSLNYLRDGMVDLLATKLTGEVGPVAVDPRTTLSAWRRATESEKTENETAEVRMEHIVGAGQILHGDIVQVGRNLVLNGTVRGAADRDVRARASVFGPRDSLLGLVDRLAMNLLALQAGESEHRLALLTSRSIPALHAYLDGRAAYRRGESGLAMTDFARALELDSTFASAALELVVSSGWVFTYLADGFPYRVPLGSGGQVGQVARYQLQWIRAMDLAWKNRERLSQRDFAILMALRGPRYPEGTRARELLNTWWQLAENTPDRADTWYLVGYILLYQGPAIGRRDAAEQAAAAFRRALALDPEFAPPLAGLLELAAQRGDSAEVRRLGAKYLARDSAGPTADYVRWHVAAVTRDAARLQAIHARFDSVDLETLDRIQWTAQVEGIDLEDADRATATMIRRSPNDSGYVLYFANMLALNRGRPRESLRIMDDMRKVEGGWANYDLVRLMYGVYWDSDRPAAAESARFIESHAASIRVDPASHWRLAHWLLAQGDTARALRVLELLHSDSVAWDKFDKPALPLLTSVLVASIRRQPDLPDLLARADSLTAGGCCSIPGTANLQVARAHERAGDLLGALAAVRRQRWYAPPEFLSVSLREEGRLAALTGDTTGAIKAYRHYLTLRSDPEPELRPDAARIRRELDRLEHGR